VLVVEDDDGVRATAQRVLQRAGIEVVVARSGEEALELLARDAAGVDVVLSDVVMARMTGIELASEVEKRWPRARAVLMSGYTPEALAHRGAGAPREILRKPFTPEELLDRVRAAFVTV
jgi:two-component system cell cycle sensor histidine kinase/response regulator CckA